MAAERFFEKANQLKEHKSLDGQEADFNTLIDQLSIEFSRLNDDFRLMPDEERNLEATRVLETNAKHVYFQVGLKLVENMLNIEHSEDISCAQKQQIDPLMDVDQSMVQGAESLQLQQDNHQQQLQGGMLKEQGRIEELIHEQPPLQLAYADYIRLVQPIFSLNKIECATTHNIKAMIQAIQKVQELANELGYSLSQDERNLVVFIHEIMDSTTKELWAWEVMDRALPGLEQLVEFLKKRCERMKPAEPLRRTNSDDWSSPSGSGISNPPKRAKFICAKCGGPHTLCQCKIFRNSTLQAKLDLVHQNNLCENCFSSEHATDTCSDGPCKKCLPLKHNTQLCPRRKYNY